MLSLASLKREQQRLSQASWIPAYGASHGRRKEWWASIYFEVSKLGSQSERFRRLLCQDTKIFLVLWWDSHLLFVRLALVWNNEGLANGHFEKGYSSVGFMSARSICTTVQ